MGTAVLVMYAAARMQMIEIRSNMIAVSIVVFNPVLFVSVPLLLSPDRSAEMGTRVAVGVALMISWSATAWGAAAVLRRERTMGTLARALCGVIDARLITLGKGFAASVFTSLASLVTIGLTLLALRQPITFPHPRALGLGYLLLIASGSAMGLLIGSVFVVTRYGAQVSAILVTPILLLGGILVPSDYFIPPLSWVGAAFSLRWLREFMVSSALASPNYVALGWSAGLTISYTLGGMWLFARVIGKARRDGNLDLY